MSPLTATDVTPDTAAPIPSLATMTPRQLADHHTAVVLHQTGLARGHISRGDNAAAHTAYHASTTAYTIAYLARALLEHAPAAADKVMEDLAAQFVFGDASEWAADRAREAGIDPDALIESGVQAAKENS